MTKKQLLKELVSYAGTSNLTVEHCVHLYLQLVASDNFDLKTLVKVELYDYENPNQCVHIKLTYRKSTVDYGKNELYKYNNSFETTTTIETCVLDNLNEEYLNQQQLLYKYQTKYGNDTY